MYKPPANVPARAQSTPPYESPYVRRMQTERESLRKTAQALSSKSGIRIEIEPYGARSYYDPKEGKVVVGTADMWKYDSDHYVALILHELAHTKHTPDDLSSKVSKLEMPELNALEDERINYLTEAEYDGAPYFLDRIRDEYAADFEEELERSKPFRQYDSISNHATLAADEILAKPHAINSRMAKIKAELAKEKEKIIQAITANGEEWGIINHDETKKDAQGRSRYIRSRYINNSSEYTALSEWCRLLHDVHNGLYHEKELLSIPLSKLQEVRKEAEDALEKANDTAVQMVLDQLRMKAYMLAYVLDRYPDSTATTGSDEGDKVAHIILDALHKAKTQTPKQLVESAKELSKKLLEVYGTPLDEENGDGTGNGTADSLDEKAKRLLAESRRYGSGVDKKSINNDEDGREYMKADEMAREDTARARRKMIASIRKNQRTQYKCGQLKGKLNKKSLHKAPLKWPPRIYQKRIKPKGKKYAIYTLFDVSGSMENTKKLAAYCGVLLTRAFKGVGYPAGMAAFSSHHQELTGVHENYVAPVAQERIVRSNVWGGGTYLADPVKSALQSLARTGNDRHKLLFIVTDADLYEPDKEECVYAIKNAKRKMGKLTSIVVYINASPQGIGDNEIRVSRTEEVIPHVKELLHKIAVSEVD